MSREPRRATPETRYSILRILCGWVLALGALSSCGTEEARPTLPEKREAWTGSRVVGSPEPPLPYRAVRAFPKLSFRNSLYAACEPGTDRVMVVEQRGRVFAFRNAPDVEKTEVFLELPNLWSYSIYFHPKYAENHWVYVFANGPPDTEPGKKNRILRYTVKEGRCDRSTEHLVIEWTSNGHDGGEMGFGPDGMLYITAGDGTTDSDGNVTGQDLRDLNSGMIRIDVEHPDPGRNYSIPKDNPFLAIPGARGELWAYGFRNPWRMTFDPKTGDLWVGDIGQDLWEMVEVVQRGDNYGWSVVEGGHPFHTKRTPGPTPIRTPLIAHPHSEARSVTGGIVYTGAKYPDLQGAYVYGDYATGRVWGVKLEGGRIVWHRELAKTSIQTLGFAQDPAGEILLVDYGGAVYRLEPRPPEPPREFPRTISASGAFASVRGYPPHPALLPYDVNSPLWSDGAGKERHLGLPGLSTIGFSEEGAWTFPEGTVLVKTFSLAGRRIETRFLTLQENEWVGYSYAWNDEGSDATLVDSKGMTREIGGQSWYFPSRSDCMVCHSRAGSFVLGVNTLQMNRGGQLEGLERLGVFRVNLLDHVRAQEAAWVQIGELRRSLKRKSPELPAALRDRIDPQLFGFGGLDPLESALQLGWLIARRDVTKGLEKEPKFSSRLPRRPAELRRLTDPADASAPLEARARAYLHANCAQCHVEAGGGNSAFEVNVNTPRERMKLVDVKPIHDAFGIEGGRLVAPGDPARSVLYHRVTRRGPGQMPPLASSVVDERGTALLREWIEGLSVR